VKTRRVLITVGAGGVGKTTTAAALGIAAAKRGRRVLVMTIDPARRLAESLGITNMSTEAVDIDPRRFADAGYPLEGSLTAMMLDTKRTFDDLVIKHSSTKENAQRLLGNKLYQYVSTSLAGTQEYMAMEKLVAVKSDPRWDLIILDTPPTANALDFLDAPERLMEALDSATMKWFVEAFQSSGKLSLNLLARSAAMVLRGIGKITGGGFLEAMAEYAERARAGGGPLVLCGDMNVARSDKDVYPRDCKPDVIGQRPDERALFERILATGLVDVGRALDPDTETTFTWWPPWRNMRQKNQGWRIDYVLASQTPGLEAKECKVLTDVGTSDHAPVVATFA